jgi:hypothetical protein
VKRPASAPTPPPARQLQAGVAKGTKGGAGVVKRCWRCAARSVLALAALHECPYAGDEWNEMFKRKARAFLQRSV